MSSFLGIDTSNYTTSAAISENGTIVKTAKRMLSVSEGQRGLRQSDAVFQHTVNLPSVFSDIGEANPCAIGVSSTPRDNEGSYMPCFLSGVAVAEAISKINGIPIYKFSHQRGHIAAALYSCKREELHNERFLAFHVSGGTTELTLVEYGKITLLGGTKDISAGKAIDRVGVKLGFTFPCGMQLESISDDPDNVKPGKICVDGLSFNLSGIENKTDELIKSGAEMSYVAAYVIRHISAVIEKLTENAIALYGNIPIIYAGGVMSNSYMRSRLTSRFGGLFAEPQYSCDNAAGIARLTELVNEGAIKYAL